MRFQGVVRSPVCWLSIPSILLVLFFTGHIRLCRSIINAEGSVKKAIALPIDADPSEAWTVDIVIPAHQIEQVQTTCDGAGENGEIYVELLFASLPTKLYKGKLAKNRIRPAVDDGIKERNATAQIRIHPVNGDIPVEFRVPKQLIQLDEQVHARIRCKP